MERAILVAALLFPGLIAFQGASAQGAEGPHWKSQLARTLVEVEAGKFRYEDRALCEGAPQQGWPGQTMRFQIRSGAKAPADGTISRDVFLSLVTSWESTVTKPSSSSQGADVWWRISR